MGRLLTDEKLRNLTEIYHFLDGSEIPFLIKALHSLRDLQKDLKAVPELKAQYLLMQAEKLDDAIAFQILQSI
ncbi:hypothetical protein [Nostoc sp.]|uniref:hypothetical protein n=1 Tax=Nostoc sp. TaxID=1180 RepID=UPI002FF9C4CF